MIKAVGYMILDDQEGFEVCNVKVDGETIYIDDNNICDFEYIDQLIEVLQKLKQDYSNN